MTDDRQPSGIADALVRQLEAEAELVDAGRFTLDFAAAREKLASYRQADPNAFVLLLVEAAHLLAGCSEIAFSITDHQTRVRLVGAKSTAHELRTVFDALFVDMPDSLGRQRLALAIDGVLAQPGATIELGAISADHRELVVNFAATGQTIEERETETHTPPMISLVFSRPDESDEAPTKQRALLLDRARYARRLVLVGDERVDRQTALDDVVAPVEVVTTAGVVVGQAGWSLARAEGVAILVAHGVIIEELREPGWQQGFIALVDVGDLRRDLSLTKLIRDEAFAARVAAIRAVHDALPVNPTTEVFYAYARGGLSPLAMFIIGFVMLVGGIPLVAIHIAFLAVPIVIGTLGIVLMLIAIGSWREDRAWRRALPAVGMIESVTMALIPGDRPYYQMTLELRVSIADREPYLAALACIPPNPGSYEEEQFKRGACFHLLVDRQDRSRVWFALFRG